MSNDDPEGTSNEGFNDFASFEAKTKHGGHEIAGLYFYQQLDCLIDLACKVSYDFFKRPHLYINLGSVASPGASGKSNAKEGGVQPLREVLAKLQGRLGYSEVFPGKSQRDGIYRPIFGSGGDRSTAEEGDFPRLRDALLDAAAAFAERVL